MKRFIFVTMLIVAMLCLNSCSKKEKDMNIIESDVSILASIKNEYKFSRVSDFLKKNPDIDRFNRKYKGNCYKRFSDLYYTVLGTEEGPIIVCFDANMQFNSWMKIAFSEDAVCELLKDINKDSSLDDVMKSDPDGNYPFLNSGWNEYPKISYHIFKNGTVYLIQYDSSNKVVVNDNYIL